MRAMSQSTASSRPPTSAALCSSCPTVNGVVFRVLQRDLQTIGIEHLASHAGVTDIGFRVYYEQKGKRRFIIGAEEIPPPTG